MENATILIVDDEPKVRSSLERALASAGFNPESVSAGEQAVGRCQQTSFDLVVSEIQMPGMDGLELLERLKQLDDTQEVIFLTGQASLESAIRALRDNGAFDYFVKPIEDMDILISSVQQALEKRRLSRQNRSLLNAYKDQQRRLEDQNTALRDSQARYRALFDGAPDAILITDPDSGVILDANQSACDLLQLTLDELRDRHHAQLHAPALKAHCEQLFQQCVEDCRQTSLTPPVEITVLRADGVEIPVEISSCINHLQGKEVLQGYYRDISDRKRMEHELLRTRKFEAVGRMAGGLAHDFNNLLMIVLGNIDLAIDELPRQAPAGNYLKSALKALARAKELTSQLMMFAKGEQPQVTISDMGQFVRDTAMLSLAGSNVKCEFNFGESLHLVQFDPTQLKQALHNIIINAMDAMPTGGTLKIDLDSINLYREQVPELEAGVYVRIRIRDQGVGISHHHLPLIFDPYFSTKQLGTQKGMGLGLATAYAIVQKHQGLITVNSCLGEGTTFILYFPAAKSTATDTAEPQPCAQSPPTQQRVLVMDDEPLLRTLAGQMLGRLGYQADMAENGEQALSMYQAAMASGNIYAAVILDLTIPGGMGGKETFDQLKALNPNVIAIISSGYANDPLIAQYDQHGFSGAVVKPYTLEDLQALLHALLSPSGSVQQ